MYILSPPMMLAVKALTEATEAETARLSPDDALDVVDLLRDRLLQLESKYMRAARADR